MPANESETTDTVVRVVQFGFFTIGKSDRSVRSDTNKMQFLRLITI